MTQNEALRLALEAFGEIDWSNNSQWQSDRAKEAIACLRLVIDAENISSKPMAWEQFYPEMGKPKLAYLSPTESPENACYIPPQRTWVGLTEEELYEIYDESDDGSSPCGVCGACSKCKIEVAIARAIQAKLKDKNNG